MGTLGYRIAGFIGATLEALAGLAFTVGVIVVAMGFGGRW
jgi:hypothetical protein